MVEDMQIADKAALRAELLTARRALPEHQRAVEATALQQRLTEWSTDADTVCAYVPVGAEPGAIAMLDTLHDRGLRVLLPIARTTDDDTDTPLPLSWGQYHPGRLDTARFGLLEPDGPRLEPSAVAEAGVVLVPALAVDRRGVRLGRGAGFYDRSLGFCNPDARLIAIVRDAELVDELPFEPHDVRMTHVLTPRRGLVAVGAGITAPR